MSVRLGSSGTDSDLPRAAGTVRSFALLRSGYVCWFVLCKFFPLSCNEAVVQKGVFLKEKKGLIISFPSAFSRLTHYTRRNVLCTSNKFSYFSQSSQAFTALFLRMLYTAHSFLFMNLLMNLLMNGFCSLTSPNLHFTAFNN